MLDNQPFAYIENTQTRFLMSSCLEWFREGSSFLAGMIDRQKILQEHITGLVQVLQRLKIEDPITVAAWSTIAIDEFSKDFGATVDSKIIQEKIHKISFIIIQRCGPSIENIPTHFNRDDEIVIEVYSNQMSQNRSTICFDFAFYHLSEINAYPYLLGNWPSQFALDTINFLNSWGYRTPQTPRRGDLVVYMHPNHLITHCGVVLSKTNNKYRIISKFGSVPNAWNHSIEEVPLEYGHRVHILRYSEPQRLHNYLVKTIDLETLYPLTTRGVIERLNGLTLTYLYSRSTTAMSGSFLREELDQFNRSVRDFALTSLEKIESTNKTYAETCRLFLDELLSLDATVLDKNNSVVNAKL